MCRTTPGGLMTTNKAVYHADWSASLAESVPDNSNPAGTVWHAAWASFFPVSKTRDLKRTLIIIANNLPLKGQSYLIWSRNLPNEAGDKTRAGSSRN
ncbi:hypothetical protein R6Q59_025847 [Mikania micrantha]